MWFDAQVARIRFISKALEKYNFAVRSVFFLWIPQLHVYLIPLSTRKKTFLSYWFSVNHNNFTLQILMYTSKHQIYVKSIEHDREIRCFFFKMLSRIWCLYCTSYRIVCNHNMHVAVYIDTKNKDVITDMLLTTTYYAILHSQILIL